MSAVSLGGALPPGDQNGLAAFYTEFVRNPHQRRVMIALVDVKTLKQDVDTEDTTPVLRIRRAEIVTELDLASAQRILQRAWESRAGVEQLPMEMEDELNDVFAGVPQTVEDYEAQQKSAEAAPDGSLPDLPPYDPTDEAGASDGGPGPDTGPLDPFDDPFSADPQPDQGPDDPDA